MLRCLRKSLGDGSVRGRLRHRVGRCEGTRNGERRVGRGKETVLVAEGIQAANMRVHWVTQKKLCANTTFRTRLIRFRLEPVMGNLDRREPRPLGDPTSNRLIVAIKPDVR